MFWILIETEEFGEEKFHIVCSETCSEAEKIVGVEEKDTFHKAIQDHELSDLVNGETIALSGRLYMI